MDYFKDKAEFYTILTMSGRHILTEKTIDIWKGYSSSKARNKFEWIRQEMPNLCNLKLWRLMSLARGMRVTNNPNEATDTDESKFSHEIERVAVEIIISRRKEANQIS